MTAELDYLADRLAIQDLVYNYNHALDQRDEKLAASLFALDAVVGDKVGLDAIVAAFRATWDKYTELHHLSTNLVVDIDGDRATGRDKTIILRGSAELTTAESPTYVSYEDDYVRVGGEWKFGRRRFTVHPPTPPREAPNGTDGS